MREALERLVATDAEAVRQVADLHCLLLPGSPIARLGPAFMRGFYYRSLVADGLVRCDVAYVDGTPAGFIAYTAWPDRFMGDGVRRHLFRLAWVLLRAVLSDPRRLRTMFWTAAFMRQRPGTPRTGEGELLSFGVLPEYRGVDFVRRSGRRISAEILDRALAGLRADEVHAFRAVVEKSNTEALMFYQARGCRVDHERASLPGTLVVVGTTSDQDPHPA